MDAFLNLQLLLNDISDDALRYFFPGFRRPESVSSINKADDEHQCTTDFEEFELGSLINFPACSEKNTMCEMPHLYLDESLEEEMFQEKKRREILAEIKELQKKYGVSISEIERMLAYEVEQELSQLTITSNYDIILDDFDGREVKMDKLSKAVFLLYLRYPKGIRFKELCDYTKELEDIYKSISGRIDLAAMHENIVNLTNSTMNNSINEKVSRVKRAFRNVVDDRIAKYYYIDGKQGEVKTIALDRSLVVWE